MFLGIHWASSTQKGRFFRRPFVLFTEPTLPPWHFSEFWCKHNVNLKKLTGFLTECYFMLLIQTVDGYNSLNFGQIFPVKEVVLFWLYAPLKIFLAVWKDFNPSIEQTLFLIKRWSCSTMLLRYFTCLVWFLHPLIRSLLVKTPIYIDV